jgi:hypothetical protein
MCACSSEDRRALPCEGRGRWFDSSQAFLLVSIRGCSSDGESAGSPARRRPFEAGRPRIPDPWCNRQARRAPTSLVRVRILAGLYPHRRGPERLGLSPRRERPSGRAVRIRAPTASHDRDVHRCCGPERLRLSTPNRQDAGSSPARSSPAPVAQLAEQVRTVQPRPQQTLGPPRAEERRFS